MAVPVWAVGRASSRGDAFVLTSPPVSSFRKCVEVGGAWMDLEGTLAAVEGGKDLVEPE